MSNAHRPSRRFLRLAAVKEKTGLTASSTIYAFVAQGLFPKPIKLGPRAVAWDEAEIEAWQEQRIKERDQEGAC